jgi:hypothetical protein
VRYRNNTQKEQVINTNTGRSLYVGGKEVVDLEDGEETSVEITSKVGHKTGKLLAD